MRRTRLGRMSTTGTIARPGEPAEADEEARLIGGLFLLGQGVANQIWVLLPADDALPVSAFQFSAHRPKERCRAHEI